jgi:hypothetical protein
VSLVRARLRSEGRGDPRPLLLLGAIVLAMIGSLVLPAAAAPSGASIEHSELQVPESADAGETVEAVIVLRDEAGTALAGQEVALAAWFATVQVADGEVLEDHPFPHGIGTRTDEAGRAAFTVHTTRASEVTLVAFADGLPQDQPAYETRIRTELTETIVFTPGEPERLELLLNGMPLREGHTHPVPNDPSGATPSAGLSGRVLDEHGNVTPAVGEATIDAVGTDATALLVDGSPWTGGTFDVLGGMLLDDAGRDITDIALSGPDVVEVTAAMDGLPSLSTQLQLAAPLDRSSQLTLRSGGSPVVDGVLDLAERSWWVLEAAGFALLDGRPAAQLSASLVEDRPVTRAELAVALQRVLEALGVDLAEVRAQLTDILAQVDDVDPSDEHAVAVAAAIHRDYMRGFVDGSFRPDANLTRAQAALVVVRALDRSDVPVELEQPSGEDSAFDDLDEVAIPEQREAIEILAATGIVEPGGSFEPGRALTTADVADLVVGVRDVADGPLVFGLPIGTAGQGTIHEGDAWFWLEAMTPPDRSEPVTHEYVIVAGGHTFDRVAITWPAVASEPDPVPTPTPAPDPDPAPSEPEPTEPVRSVTEDVEPGGTVSTGTSPTEEVPVVTAVTVPSGGTVTVESAPASEEDAESSRESGYEILGEVIVIDAPAGTVDEPLRLAFTADASLVGSGDLVVVRDGQPISEPCLDGVRAEPDPCLLAVDESDGLVRVEVLSSRASTWYLARTVRACPAASTPAPAFGDVDEGPHAAGIGCAVHKELMEGFADGTFRPGADTTRGQVASILLRLLRTAGVDVPAVESSRFPDAVGSTHEGAIEALATLGIVTGRTDGTFAPREVVTRAQLATMLVALVEEVEGTALPGGDPRFSDVGGVHAANIDAAARAGLVLGRADGTFAPGEATRRDQFATLATRLLDRWVAAG